MWVQEITNTIINVCKSVVRNGDKMGRLYIYIYIYLSLCACACVCVCVCVWYE